MASRRAATRARADETWQRLVDNRPGVEDLLEGKRLPVAAIDANPQQPRKGPLEGIEELAASIREYGLLQPIVVSPRPDGRYVCIAGHRRLAAYRHLAATEQDEPARWAVIPAVERDDHSDEWLVLGLLENLSRSDLTDAEIISGLSVLHDLRGWSQREIARRLGVTSGWINQYFRVAGDPDVSQFVQTGQLSVAKGHAIVLAKSPDARRAALDAGRQSAPLRVIRQLAKGDSAPEESAGPGPHSDYAADAGAQGAGTAAGDGRAARSPDGGNSSASRAGAIPAVGVAVATAVPDAGVRDLAELAAQLGTVVDLRHLEFAKLIRDAFEKNTPVAEAAAVLRLMRADLRRLEALVRGDQARRAGEDR